MPRVSHVSPFVLVYLASHCPLVLVLTCLLVPTLLSFVSGYVPLLPPTYRPPFPLPFIPISLPIFRTYLLARSLRSVYFENYLIPRSRRASEFRLHGSNVLKYGLRMYKRASETTPLNSCSRNLVSKFSQSLQVSSFFKISPPSSLRSPIPGLLRVLPLLAAALHLSSFCPSNHPLPFYLNSQAGRVPRFQH
jgi:hypothetical protein